MLNMSTIMKRPPRVCSSIQLRVNTKCCQRCARQPEAQRLSDATQASRHAAPPPSPSAPAAGLTGRPADPPPPATRRPSKYPGVPSDAPVQPLGPNQSVLLSHPRCLTLCLFCQEEPELHFVALQRRRHD